MSNKNKRTTAIIAALIGQTIFGFTFVFTKLALSYASPAIVIADRYIIAFAVMTIFMIVTKNKIALRGKNVAGLVAMSLFQPTLYFIFETYGIKFTTSSFSAVMIALIPVITLLCGMPMLKEIPSVWQCIFTVISVSGVVIITMQGKNDGTITPAGVILLAGAVISAVGYNILSRKISSDFSSTQRTYAMSFIGMVSFVLIALIQNRHNPLAVVSAFQIKEYVFTQIYLGIIASVGAFVCINFANTHLPVAKSTSFSCITTVVSVFAGVIFLNESMKPASILASLMIIVGVFGVQMSKSKMQNKKPAPCPPAQNSER